MLKFSHKEYITMKTITYNPKQTKKLPEYYQIVYPDGRFLFFDIETTGFSAKNTTLYLIGALWYEEDGLHIIQWFNDDGKSETELLSSFFAFSLSFTHLVQFNGLGFDLPYLKQKCLLANLDFSLDQQLTQIDIFKEIRSYKSIFQLEHMKQVSIEEYLHIDRKDTYTGKELIQLYKNYLRQPDDELEKCLLLHNHDDLLGMPKISQILHYKAFFEKNTLKSSTYDLSEDKLTVHFVIDEYLPLPQRISISKNGFYLNALNTHGILQIPLFHGTLKHYFNDYKNYYYLPLEDMAIHKSIATYVDSANKVKATKHTCYVKKEDYFIPCIEKGETTELFYTTPNTSPYQTLSSILEPETTLLNQYIRKVISSFL